MTSRRAKFAWSIWTTALLICVALAVLMALHTRREQAKRLADAGEQLAASLQTTLGALNRSLLRVDLFMAAQSDAARRAVAAGGDVDAAALRAQWKTLIDQDVLLRDVVLLDADGKVLASARDSTPRLGAWLAPEFLASVRAQPFPSLRVSEPTLDQATGEWALWFARKLPDDPQRRVVAGALPVSVLTTLFAHNSLQDKWVTTLEREDGVILALSPASEAHLGMRLPAPLRDTDGRARPAQARVGSAAVLQASRASLYPTLLVSLNVPLEQLRTQVHDEHRGDWWSAATGALLVLLLAGVLDWHQRGQDRARARVEDARQGLLRTQAELAEAKSTLDEALDAMSDGFVVFDAQERLLTWNRRYVELFPYLRGRLHAGMHQTEIGEIAAQALLPDASAEEREAFKVARRAERLKGQGVSETRSLHGRIVEARDRRTSDGQFVSLLRDVTEARQTARALEEARDAAEAGARAKSRFLAAMSHEIRTPLNAVLGMNGLLLDTPLTAQQRRYVELIGKSGESLLAIINDILDLSRLESGRLTLELVDFSLLGAVHDVVSMLTAPAQTKGLALELRADDEGDPLFVRGDPGRLRQVMFNLIGNSIKFTDRGGVTVELRHRARDVQGARIAVTIVVRDTGIGIDPAALPHLFERFSQADSSTSRRFGGTGLGLAIAQEIVRLMGGHIEVDSALGRGSEFRVELDLERAAASAHTPAPRAVTDEAGEGARSLRVLVAEDNGVNQLLIRAQLERMGHHVDIVGDGAEAVQQVQAAPYDIVLMDVHMPVMDGLDATRAIRALGGAAAALPIVALTAAVMTEDRIACQEAGMRGFVGKPIDYEHLRRVIDDLTSPAAAPA